MSSTELHKGTLRKISSNPEKFAKWYFKANNIKLYKSYDTPLEQLLDEYYDKYIILNRSLYSINDINLGESDCSWYQMNSYGEIEYFIQFYNGGCSLNEALEGELKGIV